MGLLEEAAEVVDGDREADYGSPNEMYDRLAAAWSGVLGTQVTGAQAILCMETLKVIREAIKRKRDNLVDGVGYWAVLDKYYAGCEEEGAPV